ncbi:MAG: hypothetical protein ABIH34_02585, partial [Nanoarchaeota archaeon]
MKSHLKMVANNQHQESNPSPASTPPSGREPVEYDWNTLLSLPYAEQLAIYQAHQEIFQNGDRAKIKEISPYQVTRAFPSLITEETQNEALLGSLRQKQKKGDLSLEALTDVIEGLDDAISFS